MTKHSCPICARPFGQRRRCYFCDARIRHSGETRQCQHCGKEFYVAAWQLRKFKGGGSYCSRECTKVGIKGKKFRIKGKETTRYITPAGYVLVKVGIHEWEYEHRLVVEKALGRRLERDETVHHINRNRSDNRLNNLEVISRRDHMSLHGKEGAKVRHRRSKD